MPEDPESKIVRSGLCHGPQCTEKLTEERESEDFCSEGCQARWRAAYVGVKPEQRLPYWSHLRDGWRFPDESVEALRLGDHVVIGDRHFIVAEHSPKRTLYEPIGWARRLSRWLLRWF